MTPSYQQLQKLRDALTAELSAQLPMQQRNLGMLELVEQRMQTILALGQLPQADMDAIIKDVISTIYPAQL